MASVGVDAEAIYRRTADGERAIELTSQRVSRVSRRLLNLLDGVRPVRELPAVVPDDELPGILRELLDRHLIERVGSSDRDATGEPHPELALVRMKRALAGAFERELGPDASVLEARVQDCVSTVVLRNVVRELVELVAARKNRKAADRIAAIVRANDPA